jgi:hypothetical protein
MGSPWGFHSTDGPRSRKPLILGNSVRRESIEWFATNRRAPSAKEAALSTVRLWFWLDVIDLLAWLGLFGSRAYLYALRKASDATDWGEGERLGDEKPF